VFYHIFLQKLLSDTGKLRVFLVFGFFFDKASTIWTSLGGIWTESYLSSKDIVPRVPSISIEIDIINGFSKAFETSSKRFYRDVEMTNNEDTRIMLAGSDPVSKKRKKLMASIGPEAKQDLETNTENLYRSVLMRCCHLPLTSATSFTPKKQKSSKKSNEQVGEEDINAGSGGFIRVAQLLSQLTPEFINIHSATRSITGEGKLTRTDSEPKSATIVSTISAHFTIAGLACAVAHRSTYAAWFLWKKDERISEAIIEAKEYLDKIASAKNHAFTSDWTDAISAKLSEIELSAHISTIYSIWKSPSSATGLTKVDLAAMLDFCLKTKSTTADVDAMATKMDMNASGVVEWKQFERWAKWDKAKGKFAKLQEMRFAVECLDGKSWTPKLFVIDLKSATAYLYSQKALSGNLLTPRSQLKKLLKGTFDWKNHRFTFAGPVLDSLSFGKSPQDDSFIIKFKPEEFQIASRMSDALRAVTGIGTQSSFDNIQQHALNLVDLAVPALLSIGDGI
jgi:hypothetical protein